MTDFNGLVAVVTGGASGIGAATAELLRSAGPRVAVLDRTIAQARGDADDARGALRRHRLRQRRRSRRRRSAERLGGIDILVNNAGIGAVGDVAANDDEEWHACSTSTSSGSPA